MALAAFGPPGSLDLWRFWFPGVFPLLRRCWTIVSFAGDCGLLEAEMNDIRALDLPPSPAGEGDLAFLSTFSRFAGRRTCWHVVAEDDDFPSATTSACFKVSPARWWCGGGGGEARPRLALNVSAVRRPRDRVVISCSRGVCCNGRY